MRISILMLVFLSHSIITNAQTSCNGPGREPTSPIAVCGYLTYNERNVTNCQGFANLPNPTAGCGDIVTTDNSLWYKFHCYGAGSFGFVLTPQSLGDDYDWELMDVTGRLPGDVYTMELRVSLNLSGQTGKTGCTAGGTLDVHCASGPPGSQFNRLVNFQAGHDYLLMVNNWSSSGSGYDLDFSGTASLTNNLPPTVSNVGIVGCDARKLRVTFSEDILCTSIANDASEFTITDGTNIIAKNASLSACAIGAGSVPYLTIDLPAPIPPGNYQLIIANGTDGNTFENVCKLAMLPATVPFTITAIPPVAVNNITFSGCAPTLLNVKLTKPVWCSSITASGSELSFLPANPAVTIASVQSASCNGGSLYTDELQVYLQNPLPHGNYQLVVKAGTDGNTFIDTCYNPLVANTNFPFVINQTTTAPVMQTISFDECHPDKVVVTFDKPLFCSTISSTAEFTISPGSWPISTVSFNCVNNVYTSQLVLNLQNPLPAGNFNLMVGNGADNNTLSDTCFAFMAAGTAKAFVTTKAPAPKFDSVQFDKCNPSFVKLFYSKPIKCATIGADGSDYTITGPSPVTIASVTTDGNCATLGYTKWVLLQFAQPVNVFGNYVVHNKVGNDLDGIIDTCNAAQSIAETIGFTALIKPSAAFTSQVKFGCIMDTVVLSHAGGNGINSWIWTFADGSTLTGQTVTKLFPVSTVSTTVQLAVDNGFCSDVVSQTITLDNAFEAKLTLTPKDTVCLNTPVNFANNSTGKNLQYLWQFGDNTQFAGQTPPPHVYATTGSYNVQLLVTDPYGCSDVADTLINIAAAPVVDFTGLNAQYCNDKTISLTRSISNNVSSYTWDNGDGVTIQNKPVVQFNYAKEGLYTISLTAVDKYCGNAVARKQVQIYAVPTISLGNDTTLCPGISIPLGMPFNAGYTYLWNTGATTSQIFTALFTADYSLTIDNNGCKAADAINVKVLSGCLIKVPGAFTPNNDSHNDKLMAINADLAKEFTFKVYNRLGELMFATTNPMEGWNGYYKGLKADAGTYVWQLGYIDPTTKLKIFETGTSILLR